MKQGIGQGGHWNMMAADSNTLRAAGAGLLFLGCVIALLCLLALPFTAAIGPFYWDTLIYYDATARIASGQIPTIDFLAPVGPLSYWLFYALHELFPDGQGVYLATWSILLVSAPAMAPVICDAARKSGLVAMALAVPFLVFSALPFNVEQFYPYPGVDGYGIYNRHISQLLYVVVAALMFAGSAVARVISLTIALAALFLTKITGFVIALPLVLLALFARRLRLRELCTVAALLAAVLAGLELWCGLTSAYVASVAELVAMNEGELLINIAHAGATHIAILTALGLLLLMLFWFDRDDLAEAWDDFIAGRWAAAIGTVARSTWMWLLAVTIGGMMLESQNWGGQAFLFIWPVLLKAALLDRSAWPARGGAFVTVLIAAATLPTLANIGGRAIRTYAAQMQYDVVQIEELGPLSAISKRDKIDRRVALIREQSISNPDYFLSYAAAGELPRFTYYADPEFQLAWLAAIGEGVAAIRTYEARNDVRFETILSLNFVNPFPYLLGRDAVRHVTIGKDPARTLPPIDAQANAEIADTDLVLWPKCPVTVANAKIREAYGAHLDDRDTVSLSPCWDGLIRPELAPDASGSETATANGE
ncbi:hypothetical protein E2A64_07980 [Pseudohoeflea suaedae]|uniref:Glycosyltransferase RgtA/B/C/D-like domain-containing protein n=1 Tax=Pseudohoeflea suaedae TaxID=877384 RepID=A0A4R5PPJ7_9HYPH|nr:hypothetical protein [Pseudohoeflea suaedae]TDH39012.1 hypothetical protein E2A64_07980 [Pseudohoeflea suaedae]